jgi:hypothetical protein
MEAHNTSRQSLAETPNYRLISPTPANSEINPANPGGLTLADAWLADWRNFGRKLALTPQLDDGSLNGAISITAAEVHDR